MRRHLRSAWRVWASLEAALRDRCELVTDCPDIWLWDFTQTLPRTDRPVVGLVHEAPDGEGIGRDLLALLDGAGRRMAERATRVVTCSKFGASQIAERYGVPAEHIDVAYYGVDHTTFRPEGPDAADLLGPLGITDPYVLFVGTVLPRKNLPLLREAMISLPDHRLVVLAAPALQAGSEELMEEATSPIGGKAVPNLVGVDENELAALMRGAAALCLPSLSEGFGLPVVEAMACGTPVVVSRRGALPEVVGDAGIVVEPDLPSLIHGLRTAVRDRERLAGMVKERAESFSWESTANHVIDSFRRALAESGRTGATGP